MKKILLSSVALFGLTAGALAADLPRRVVAPAPYIPVPVFTWTGFYVGVNAGYGFSDRNHDDVCASGSFGFGFGDCFGGSGLSVATVNGLAPVVPLTGNTFGFGTGFDNRNDRDSFVGGGQIGYNYQFTPGSGWVIGIEADIQGTDFGHRRNDDDFFAFGGFGGLGGGTGIFTAANVFPAVAGSGIATPTGFGNGALGNVALFNTGFGNGFGNNGFDRNRIDWFATVRGRLGYAIDRLLIFATGGVAFTDRNDHDDFNNFGGFGTGIPNGASLVGTGFYTNAGARFAGSLVAPTNTFGFFGNRHDSEDIGYAVGGGIEYAFTNNLTVKIEGLYVNFERDHRNNSFLGGNVVGVTNTGAPVLDSQIAGFGFDSRRRANDFGVVRAGLNYKFTSF